MTAIETRAEDITSSPVGYPAATGPAGPVGIFSTTDHKRLGALLVGLSALIGGFALMLRLLVTLEVTDAANYVVLDGDTYNQLFVLSMDSVLYLLLMPMFIGIAFVVVPAQVGASSLAYPRAAASSVWGMVLGGALVVGSYAINGGPFGGEANGVDLYLIGLGFFVASVLLGALCVASTVMGLRGADVDFRDVPAFAWSAFVTSVAMLLSLPVLLGLLGLLYVDHRYGRLIFAGNNGVFTHISWMFRNPQSYLLAIPALGVLAEVVTAVTGQRDKHLQVTQASIGAFAILSFGAWVQPAIAGGQRDIIGEPLFLGVALLILIPLNLVLFKSFFELKSSKQGRYLVPVGFSILGSLFLLVAAAAGVLGALYDAILVDGGDVPLAATTFVQGQTALVLLGGALMGLYAATHLWAEKVWGKNLSAGLGLVQLGFSAAGVFLVGLGFMLSGALWDQPFAAPFYDNSGSGEIMGAIAAFGYALMTIGALVFIVNILISVTGVSSSDKGGQS